MTSSVPSCWQRTTAFRVVFVSEVILTSADVVPGEPDLVDTMLATSNPRPRPV